MGSGKGCISECCGNIIQFVFILCNILFFICGAAILGVCIWILVDDSIKDYLDLASNINGNDNIMTALYILIAVGAFTFLVGLLGCCGACKGSSCMLCVYAVLVGVIFACQIAGAIIAGIYKDEIQEGLESGMADQAHNYVGDDTEDATTRAFYRMQYEFECCGGSGYEDYQNSLFYNTTNYAVPKTCCKLENDDPLNPVPEDYPKCLSEAEHPSEKRDQLYATGCYSSFNDWLEEQAAIILGIAAGLAIFQIACIIIACCVRSKAKGQENYA